MRRLSPKLEEWLKEYHQTVAELMARGFTPTPENTRKGMADLSRSMVTDVPDIALVRNDRIQALQGDIPVRIYHPAPEVDLPVLIYYHGGGHMAGSVNVYDPICRKLAIAATHIVVSTEYRLTPENPYPAGVEDALAVAENVWEPLDRLKLLHARRLSIAGDSGGGALCATVAHQTQHHEGVDLQNQVLIYPSLDYTLSMPSVEFNGAGYLLEKDKIRWYFDHYFQQNEDRREASPLFMEVTQRLPRTLVITAEFCPLRDEGRAYVQQLQSKDVHAQRLHFDTMVHAFLNLETITKEACTSTYKTIGRFLNKD